MSHDLWAFLCQYVQATYLGQSDLRDVRTAAETLGVIGVANQHFAAISLLKHSSGTESIL